jgi:hypothetical protein
MLYSTWEIQYILITYCGWNNEIWIDEHVAKRGRMLTEFCWEDLLKKKESMGQV